MTPNETRFRRAEGLLRRFGTILKWLALVGLAAWMRPHALPATRTPATGKVVRPRPLLRRARGHTKPPRQRIAWSAILGAAMVIMAVLAVLGAVGLGWFLSGHLPALVFHRPLMAALLASAGVGLVFFFGGWMAGHFAGPRSRLDTMLHGLAAWALVTLLSVSIGTLAGARAAQKAAEFLAGTAAGAERLATGAMQAAALITAGGLSGATVPVPLEAFRTETVDLARQAAMRPQSTLEKMEEAFKGIESLLTEVSSSAPTTARPGLPGPPVDNAAPAELIAQQTGVPPSRAVEGIAQ